MSDLLPGPAIASYRIQQSDEHHILVINQLIVRCTLDEYRLALALLEHYEQPVSFGELIAHFHDASLSDPALLSAAKAKLTHTLSHLRTKLWSTDFTIVRVVDVGYMLIHRDKTWSLARSAPGAGQAE